MFKSFRVISDLHLELLNYKQITALEENLYSLQNIKNVPFLIMAGDIVSYNVVKHEPITQFIQNISKQYKKVFYVLGNHEYYGLLDSDIKKTVCEYKQWSLLNFTNVHLLENDFMDILVNDKPVRIIGTTLWTDPIQHAYNCMTDSHYLEIEDIRNSHNIAKNFIKESSTKLIEPETKIIVITHHLPSYRFIDSKYKKSTVNSAFASQSEDLFTFKGSWVFGHTHTRININDTDINFICNPLGYRKENKEYENDFSKYDVII